MAKKNKSVFEDLMDAVSVLPWKVGVLLAAIAFVSLHFYGIKVENDLTNSTNMFKVFGIHIIPLIKWLATISLLLGALVSFINQLKRGNLFTKTTSCNSVDSLNNMNWQEFEQLVCEIFRQRGYSVSETQAGADVGFDLILKMNNEITLVQCKQWKKQKVGVSVVREIYGVMAAEGAQHGCVITSGKFTTDALKFAYGKTLLLINGEGLYKMIEALRSPQSSIKTQLESPVITQKLEMPELDPLCPICSRNMIKRVAKKGKNIGNAFWGCSQFPNCLGVVSI
jgi:restriction system protein